MSAVAAVASKVAATADENTPNSDNRYYQHSLFGSRRDFLKLAAVAGSLPMLNIVFTSTQSLACSYTRVPTRSLASKPRGHDTEIQRLARGGRLP